MTNVTISKARLDELMKKAGIPVMSVKEGNKVIADKIALIKATLKEIKEVVEVTGIELKLGSSYGVFAAEIEDVDSLHPDWNTSSYDC